MIEISIVYITARKEPMLQWFLQSLKNQVEGRNVNLDIVVVDYWINERKLLGGDLSYWLDICHVAPLPSFCQGPHRLTTQDYFDASIARNTGFVYARHPYVAFVDDVSVLMPDWLDAVVEGAEKQRILLGAYQKRIKMEVVNGIMEHSEVKEQDIDSRWPKFSNEKPGPKLAPASWFYGCSFAMPLETALKVNGFDEMCAITGYEDVNFGLRLEKAGEKFWYNLRMRTIESIEHHSNDVVMKRIDPEVSQGEYYALMDKYGIGGGHAGTARTTPIYPRYDASHFELDIVKYSNSYISYMNGFSLRQLRLKAEHGQVITPEDMHFPERFWFNGVPLRDM